MRRFLAWLKRIGCHHRVYIDEIERLTVPDKDGMFRVEAPCHVCGKSLTALYGLTLPAKLLRKPKEPHDR